MPSPSVPLHVLESIAQVRAFLRAANQSQLGLLRDVLLTLIGDVMVAMAGVSQRDELSQPLVFLTVRAASTRYPVSRSFLYERGEKEGIVTRPTGNHGKVVVNARALEQWLSQRAR